MKAPYLRFVFVVLAVSMWIWGACAAPAGTASEAPAAAPAETATEAPAAAPEATPDVSQACDITSVSGGETWPEGISPVAILVVDDFAQDRGCSLEKDPKTCWEEILRQLGAPVHRECNLSDLDCQNSLKDDITEKQALRSGTCAMTPDGQAHFMGTGAGNITRTGASESAILPAPHGQLVVAKLDQLIKEQGTPSFIKVVPVYTSGYTTASIQDHLNTCIDALTQKGIERFVVNMSFVLMPCDTAVAKAVGYLDKLSSASEQGADLQVFLANLVRGDVESCYAGKACSAASANDTLHSFLVDPKGADPKYVIAVGAAGNVGASYPFAPAIWPDVVSVSADTIPSKNTSDGDSGKVQVTGVISYSNRGEVQFPGVVDWDNNTKVYGSSFAAPELSLYEALYLASTNNSSTCPYGNNGQSTTPPLKYQPNPEDIGATYDNKSFTDAKNAYCPDMK